MDGESIMTMGVLSNNGMVVANLGHTATYRTFAVDLLEIISEFQLEHEFTVTLYSADINIETSICTFVDIKVTLQTEQNIETELQLEQNIKTRLVEAYREQSL